MEDLRGQLWKEKIGCDMSKFGEKSSGMAQYQVFKLVNINKVWSEHHIFFSWLVDFQPMVSLISSKSLIGIQFLKKDNIWFD